MLRSISLKMPPHNAAGTSVEATILPFSSTLKYCYFKVGSAFVSTAASCIAFQGPVGSTNALTANYTSIYTNTNVEQIYTLTVTNTTNANVAAGTRVGFQMTTSGTTNDITNANAMLWFARPSKQA